jgi:hypothetical protein
MIIYVKIICKTKSNKYSRIKWNLDLLILFWIDVLICRREAQFDGRDSNGNQSDSMQIKFILSYLSKLETDISSLPFIIKLFESQLKSQMVTKIKTNSSLLCLKVERM